MTLQLYKIKNFLRSIKKNKVNKINIKKNELHMLISKVNKKNFNRTINKDYNIKSIFKNNNDNDFQNYEPLQKAKLNNHLLNHHTTKTKNKSEKSTTYSTIISPMVGTFYRSPAPNEQPFIEKNDIVKPKQTVCIIEAMKLMNEIEAEVSGEIAEILVNDGDIVDCGQALMKVKTI